MQIYVECATHYTLQQANKQNDKKALYFKPWSSKKNSSSQYSIYHFQVSRWEDILFVISKVYYCESECVY